MDNIYQYIDHTREGISRPAFDWLNAQPVPESYTKFNIPAKKPIIPPDVHEIIRISHETGNVPQRNISVIKKGMPRQTVADAISKGMLKSIVSVPELNLEGQVKRDASGNIVYTQKLFKDILYSSKTDLKAFYQYLLADSPKVTDLAQKMILEQLKSKQADLSITDEQITSVVEGIKTKIDKTDVK